jgi:hypothetical protein
MSTSRIPPDETPEQREIRLQKRREYYRRHYADPVIRKRHQDLVRARNATPEGRELATARCRSYRERHRDDLREYMATYMREYRKANAEMIRELQRKYRERCKQKRIEGANV